MIHLSFSYQAAVRLIHIIVQACSLTIIYSCCDAGKWLQLKPNYHIKHLILTSAHSVWACLYTDHTTCQVLLHVKIRAGHKSVNLLIITFNEGTLFLNFLTVTQLTTNCYWVNQGGSNTLLLRTLTTHLFQCSQMFPPKLLPTQLLNFFHFYNFHCQDENVESPMHFRSHILTVCWSIWKI